MKIKRLISLIFILILSLGIFNLALAQNGSYDFSQNSGLSNTGSNAGYTTTDTSVNGYIAQIITVILSLVGVVFLGFAIYAGIVWMTAQGNEEKVSKAKEILTESIIGIIIVLAAYAISYFVLKATTGSLIQ
ncbi:MAG: pilin [Patescibacteria group bacterium]|nr:pilin [Patescibacteria group bacterium]